MPLSALHGDAAARAITARGGDVRLRCEVEAVGNGPWVAVAGERISADAVIVAVPHDAVDGLLPSGTVAGQSELAELGASPIVNVHFVFDRPVMDEAFAAALDSPVQFVFDRTEAANWSREESRPPGPLARRPASEPGAPAGAGEQVVAVSQSAAFDEIGRRPAELIDRYRSALEELFPLVAEAAVIDAVVTREHKATFAGRPGTRKLRAGPATAVGGLFLGRGVDRYRLAGHHGGRRALREPRRPAGPRPLPRRGGFPARPIIGWRIRGRIEPAPRPGGVSDRAGEAERMSQTPSILGRAKELVDPATAAAVSGLCDELRVPAEYHLQGRGKGTRPALAILSAEAVGAPPETGVPGAVAIELIHDFSLIHDDIIDNDAERRHRPTVWAKFGTGVGVVVGDALHALAFEVLLRDVSPARIRAAKEPVRGGCGHDRRTEQRHGL